MTTPTTQLYLAYFQEHPSLNQFDVKHVEHQELLDREATITVIGDSHYICIPDLDYHEIVSCKPLNRDVVKTLPLEKGYTDTIRYETESIVVETHVEAQPLWAFPSPDTFDVGYRFAVDAYTTVNVLDTRMYETYHTYPELGIALYTKTELTPQPVKIQVHDESQTDSEQPIALQPTDYPP